MNFNTLNPTSKVLKKLANYATGQMATEKDTPIIAVINACDTDESKRLVENVVSGIKADGGVCFVYNIPFFGYVNKINPLTAKFSTSFMGISKANATAIIKTNMAEGVVIVSDCAVTTCGLLQGCLELNCPAVVLPLGKTKISCVAPIDKPITQAIGCVVKGKITSTQLDEITKQSFLPKKQGDFFAMLEKLNLCVPTASVNKRGSGLQLATAVQTGKLAIKNAEEMFLLKKVFTKQSYSDIVDFALTNNLEIGDLFLIADLFNANGIETKNLRDFVFERVGKLSGSGIIANVSKVTGTALGGSAMVQYLGDKPESFKGKAWVYQTLEDADRALSSGNVPSQSVVVLHNCVGVDVSSIANVILGMGRTNEIAIATDGTCETSDVLCVQLANPTSMQNEEFANIQNGDELEIDIAKGRFNSNVLSKELNGRAKRNTIKKVSVYF